MRDYHDLFKRRILFVNETKNTFYITVLQRDCNTLTKAGVDVGVKDLFTLSGSAEWLRLPDVALFITVPPGAGVHGNPPVKIAVGRDAYFATFVRSNMDATAAVAGDVGPFIAYMRCQIKGGHRYTFTHADATCGGLVVPLSFPV